MQLRHRLCHPRKIRPLDDKAVTLRSFKEFRIERLPSKQRWRKKSYIIANWVTAFQRRKGPIIFKDTKACFKKKRIYELKELANC